MEQFSSTKITIGNTDFILTSQGKSSVLKDNWSAEPHLHPFIEMHLVNSGKAVVRVGESKIVLSENDVCIIPNGLYHFIESLSPVVSKMSLFLEVSKCENAGSDTYTVYSKIMNGNIPYTVKSKREYVRDIFSLGNDKAGFGVTDNEKIKFLLSLVLCEIFDINAKTDISENSQGELDYKTELLLELQDYLNDILVSQTGNESKLSIERVAEHLHLSTTQLRRQIRRHFNCTYRELLTEYKIERAKMLIETENIPLEKIAEICGYATYAGFYKAFTQIIGVSPDTYRSKSVKT